MHRNVPAILLTVISFVSSAEAQSTIWRDSTRTGRPISRVEFALDNDGADSRAKVRRLAVSVSGFGEKTSGAELSLSAWGECSMHIDLARAQGTSVDANEMLVDGKPGVWWKSGTGERMQIYFRSEGNLEWEVCLDSIPPSNVLSFPFHASGLVLAYQPALTAAEIAEGAYRPDSVIGSYAAYHAFGSDNWIVIQGRDTLVQKYGTGKAFHIYRPKAHDANGMTTWCGMRIDTTLTITIPSDFLKGAKYPVVVDPTFGYSSAGATQTIPAVARANINDAHTHVAGSGETIASFSVYSATGSGTQPLGLAAYSMDDGTPRLPVNRLAPAEVVSVTGVAPVWYTTLSVSQALSPGIRYCTALGDANNSVNIYYDSFGATARSNNTTSALPATWTSSGTGTVVYSMYATYTVGGSPTPSRKRRTIIRAGLDSEEGNTKDAN